MPRPPALLAGALAAAALLLTAAGGCGPDHAAEALARGDDALNRLQFADAEAHYAEALTHDPTLAEAHLKRGQVRWMTRRFEPAIADLDRALALDPGLGWAHFFRGASLFALDRLDEALPDLAAAAASDDLPAEDRARAHRMRAIAFMNAARYDDAIAALTDALALQPGHPFHHFERGLLHAEAGDAEAAVADLEHFLRAAPDSSEATALARRTLDSLRADAP